MHRYCEKPEYTLSGCLKLYAMNWYGYSDVTIDVVDDTATVEIESLDEIIEFVEVPVKKLASFLRYITYSKNICKYEAWNVYIYDSGMEKSAYR